MIEAPEQVISNRYFLTMFWEKNLTHVVDLENYLYHNMMLWVVNLN